MIVQKSHKSTLTIYRKNGGRLHFLQIVNPTVAEDCYLHLFDKESRTGGVTNYNATVAGTVLCTVDSGLGMGHGLGDAGDVVAGVILTSTNHDDTFSVTIVDEWSFYFTDTYVADDADVIFYKTVITLGTTAPKITILCRGVDADGYAGGFATVIDALFEQGVIGAFTTTLNGSAGAPTANCMASMIFEEKSR